MKFTLIALITLFSIPAQAFAPQSTTTKTQVLYADTQEATAEATVSRPKVQQLGLLTFDLDDTLYPIAPCVEAANSTYIDEYCMDIELNWIELNMPITHIASLSLTLFSMVTTE